MSFLSVLVTNSEDINTLCRKFGKNMVRAVLEDKYKKLYKKE